MQVIRAEYAGSCYGVERALSIVEEILQQPGTVSSLGSVIHNPRVVADFEARGLRVAKSPAEVSTEKVVIRSHGVPPAQRRELGELGVKVVDATCPYVLRAQRAAASLACKYPCVIVVGEAGHPEVDALTAFVAEAGAKPVVAVFAEELPVDLPEAVGVVVQTTQRVVVLDAICAELERRGITVDLTNTICNATSQRQDAALALAATVDAMVVLGGKNSSNTTRLAEICATVCERVFHIEDAAELPPEAFSGCQTVGLTAGASTPEVQIIAVERALQER